MNNDYVDTTIYGKIKQQLVAESFTIYTQFKQQWGSLTAQVTGEHYFYDPSKYEVNMSLSLTFNLFEGFSVSVNSYANVVHDQIYLPAAGPRQQIYCWAFKHLRQLTSLAPEYHSPIRLALSIIIL